MMSEYLSQAPSLVIWIQTDQIPSNTQNVAKIQGVRTENSNAFRYPFCVDSLSQNKGDSSYANPIKGSLCNSSLCLKCQWPIMSYAARIPGQAFNELSTPSNVRNGGTTSVNNLPHSGLRLPIEEANAMTKKD